ncbi:MAG: hypothetical protein QM610_05845 [Chitinophagaceae bacterium]
MMKQLTTEQIQHIDNFCEQWGVNYYDVKVELVDHISTTIENLMIKKPELTFDDAFLESKRAFGEFGFEQIIREKEKAISRNGRKQQLQYLLGFFTLPKILLTVAYISVCCAMIKFLPENVTKNIAITLMIPSFFLAIFIPSMFYHKADYYIKSYIKYNNQNFDQIRPLLLFSKKNNVAWLSQTCMLLIYLLIFIGNISDTYLIKNYAIAFFIAGLS